MTIVDSNIIIEFLRTGDRAITKYLLNNEVAICGVIETELYRGIRNDLEREELKKKLECFDYVCFEERDWIDLASLFFELRKAGLSVPFQDGIIAYLARKHQYSVWTKDHHFQLIKKVVPELVLI